jgi:hypothetical protein
MTRQFQDKPAALLKISFMLMFLWGTTIVSQAQQDQPTNPPHSYSIVDAEEESDRKGSILESICWYIPNRIMDIFDIPSFYVTMGDTQAASLRITKYLNASWVEIDAYCMGWDPRYESKFLVFTEELDENYFGFLAASKGDIKRDPTEIGLTFHLIALGLNASVSLGEALDVVVGFLGIDLRGDDHGPFLFEDAEEDESFDFDPDNEGPSE